MKDIKHYKEYCEETNKDEILSVEYILNDGYWIKGRIETCSNKNCPKIANCEVYKELNNQFPY